MITINHHPILPFLPTLFLLYLPLFLFLPLPLSNHSEIIKNKTLHFLARALPFLKDDMDSIPKVVKLTKRDPSLEPPLPPPPPASTHYDFVHTVRKKRSTTAAGSSSVVPTSFSSSIPVEERSPRGSTSSSTKSTAASLLSGLTGGVGGGGLFGSSNWNLSEARQKACEHKDGM